MRVFHALAALLCLSSCALEEPIDTPQNSDGYIEFVARPVSYDKLNVGTKATSAEIAAWENNIYTAFFMVFDNSGNRIIYRDLSPSSGHLTSIPSQTLQADKRYTNAKVCYLVNVSSEYASSLNTYALLTSTPISIEYAPISLTGCIGVPLLKKTSTDTGTPAIPMFGYKEDCNLSSVTSGYQTNPISLERLFAKVDVKLNTQNGITFNLTNYTVNNIPTNVKLPPPAQGQPTAYASSGNFLTSENTMTSYNLIDPNTGTVTTGFFFYVPEHMQGGTISKDGVDNTVESNKPLLISGTSRKPTYVEINGDLTKETAEYTGKYSIFLGKNETNDFDLERNTYYKNTVTIKGFTAENRVELLGGDQYTNLVDGESANCYIITRKGSYILPAYKGAIKSLNGAEMCYGTPHIIWNDNTENIINIKNTTKSDTRIVFEVTNEKIKPGNALVAIKHPSTQEILWSWHLWFCDGSTPSDQKYADNVYLMDRSLGAKQSANIDLSLLGNYISTSAIYLYWQDGLFYQRGRKDPLNINITSEEGGAYSTADGNDINNAIKNPNTFYKTWGADKAWTATKSQHDPCPPGYKVPSSSVWTKSQSDFNRLNSNESSFIYTNLSDLANGIITYPYSGYIGADGAWNDGILGDLVAEREYTSTLDYPASGFTVAGQQFAIQGGLGHKDTNAENPKKFTNINYEIVNKEIIGSLISNDSKKITYGYKDQGVRITRYSLIEGKWVNDRFILTKYHKANYDNKQWNTYTPSQRALSEGELDAIMEVLESQIRVDNVFSGGFGEVLGNIFDGITDMWTSNAVFKKESDTSISAYNVRCVKE